MKVLSVLLIIILFLLCLLDSVFTSQSEQDDCRTAIYKPQIPNKALTGHVIAKESVRTMDQCHILCYLEPNCVSTNYNTKPDKTPNCELSSAEDEQYPKNLTDKPGMIFQAMKNNCINKKCSSANQTCQSGYGFHGYRCVCPECSYGDHCQNFTNNTVLLFQHKSIENKVVLEHPFVTPLTAFTISLWVQIDNSTATHVPFSFATKSNPDEIYVSIKYNEITVGLKKQKCVIRNNVYDGKWHHICLTWKNQKGKMVVYIDGAVSLPDENGISFDGTIQEGVLVLGQEQDEYNGKFDKEQSFQGNLTSFNMWNKVLSGNEIPALASDCPSAEGNVVKWTDLIPRRHQTIEFLCSVSCRP